MSYQGESYETISLLVIIITYCEFANNANLANNLVFLIEVDSIVNVINKNSILQIGYFSFKYIALLMIFMKIQFCKFDISYLGT